MAWVRIDDGFPEHPKVGEAGPLAELLQVRALCYCNRQLTDGFVPTAAVHRMTTDFYFGETLEGERVFYDPLPGLLATGMWVECPGGYRIHDYEAFQPTKAEIEAKRDASKERKERWKNRKGTASEQRSSSVPTASESGGGTRSERDRNTTPDPNPIPTQEEPPTPLVCAPLDERIVEEWAVGVGRPLSLGGGGWQTIRDAVNRLAEKHDRERVVQVFVDEIGPFGENGGTGPGSLVKRVEAAIVGKGWTGSKHATPKRGNRSSRPNITPEQEARFAGYDNLGDKERIIAEMDAKEAEDAKRG